MLFALRQVNTLKSAKHVEHKAYTGFEIVFFLLTRFFLSFTPCSTYELCWMYCTWPCHFAVNCILPSFSIALCHSLPYAHQINKFTFMLMLMSMLLLLLLLLPLMMRLYSSSLWCIVAAYISHIFFYSSCTMFGFSVEW